MRLKYGHMEIEIDPRTGKGRMVVRERTPATSSRRESGQETSSVIASPGTGGASAKNGAGVPPASIDEYDSKLEASRAHYLGMLALAGDVKKFIHHPFTIQLTPERKYRPDFLVWWADGRITVEETKGHLKQKNARDSITRLHVAAAMFPMFPWMLVMQVRGIWEERII